MSKRLLTIQDRVDEVRHIVGVLEERSCHIGASLLSGDGQRGRGGRSEFYANVSTYI